MSTEAQITANRANAQSSTGPVSDQGKARAARNSTTLGLFSTTAFVAPDERDTYNEHCASWQSRLFAKGPIEELLGNEIVQAAWRLERCTSIEASLYSDDPAELDRVQASIDRARATAQRTFHRSMTELSRVQTERHYRNVMVQKGVDPNAFGVARCKEVKAAVREDQAEAERERISAIHRFAEPPISERSQFEAELAAIRGREQANTVMTPRSAPCPCGSGEKYKRCCGKDAPPVLSRAA